MIEVCVGGGGYEHAEPVVSTRICARIFYIYTYWFFYGAFPWTKNAINVSFKFSELGLAHKVVIILCFDRKETDESVVRGLVKNN